MASSTVNRPTNVALKETDINQKLQFYGIVTAFTNGKVPSNKQIDVALNSFLASKQLASPSDKLSEEGRHLVADFRDVVEKAKHLLLTKNEGNLLQDFIWQTQQISLDSAKLPSAPVDSATAKQHGNQALEGLRVLGTLIISNGQFRKLLSDATILLRDMAGDAAQSAAARVNPSQDALAQIDQPAADNTWHEVPDLSRDNIKNQLQGTYQRNKPFSRGDLQDAAGNATQTAHPGDSRDPADVADLAARDQQSGTQSGVNATAGLQAGVQTLRDRASENLPEDTKNRPREAVNATKEKTRNYLNSKMPQERREQAVWRLKKMIVEIQGHEDYQQAIETLLSLAEEYGGHGKNLSQQGAGTVKGAHADDALTTAEADLKTLIERFANSTSSDDLFESINQLYRDADRDPELKTWFTEVDRFIRKCLKEAGFIMEDQSTAEYNQLYDRGNFLLRERYRDHTNRILDEARFLGDQFDQDSQNRAFANSMNKLFTDLGNDENGKATFKMHLVNDITNVIIPDLFESVRYVPIPRIEYSDPQIDAIVENLVIESDNLMPNQLEVSSDNYFRWGRKSATGARKNKVMISISGVQMDLRDVSYYVNKKEGFPKVKDKGVMDLFLGGTGFGFKIALETADKGDQQHFFKINVVSVDVKNLRVSLKQSNHKTLFGIFKPILMGIVKPVVTKVLEKQIRESFHKGDAFAYEIYQEAQRAAGAVQNDPQNAPNMYNRYYTAAQNRYVQGKQKTKEIASDKKVNVAITQHDSIFKDIKLPGGISTKATEYKELAAKGDKWESPVFSIGSAPETTGLARISPVTRKAHNAAAGGVRGNQNLESGQSTLGQAEPRTTGRENGNYGTTNENGNYGTANGTSAGFSSQVNQAFDNSAAQDLSLKNEGLNNTANRQTGNTTLGSNNPVLTGSV